MNTSLDTRATTRTDLPHVASMHFPRLRFAVALLAATTMSAWGQSFDAVPRFVPGEVIVQFVPEADENGILEALRLGRMQLKRVIMTPVMQAQDHPGLNVVTTSLEEAIQALARHPAVAFVEPNWIYHHQAIPSDPNYSSQWGLNGPYGINAEAAWDVSGRVL